MTSSSEKSRGTVSGTSLYSSKVVHVWYIHVRVFLLEKIRNCLPGIQATIEQIEEAEKMKNNDLFDDYESSGEESGDEDTAKAQKMKVDTYGDESNQNQF